jgi:hypothetical protein
LATLCALLPRGVGRSSRRSQMVLMPLAASFCPWMPWPMPKTCPFPD